MQHSRQDNTLQRNGYRDTTSLHMYPKNTRNVQTKLNQETINKFQKKILYEQCGTVVPYKQLRLIRLVLKYCLMKS